MEIVDLEPKRASPDEYQFSFDSSNGTIESVTNIIEGKVEFKA